MKKSYKEASNQKSSENKLYLELKNINNNIFENFKNSKWPQKHPKTKNSKNSKRHVRRPQIKKFRKPTIVRIEKY